MKIYLSFITLILNLSVLAQFNCEGVDYQVSTFIDSYNNLNDEDLTSLTEGLVWDNPEFNTPIGFEFTFYNQATTELAMTSNLLGAAVMESPMFMKNYASFIAPAYANYADLAFGDSFTTGVPGGLSQISYLTEGAEGFRIFKLEWRNVGFYEEMIALSSDLSVFNVQLWLYEEDNSIEFRYGNYNIENPDIIFNNQGGPASYLVCNVNFDDWENDFLGTIISGDQAVPELQGFDDKQTGFTSMPDVNRVYRLERTIVAGINESIEGFSISAFPVPFTEELKLSSASEFDKIELIDLNGKVVFETTELTEDLRIDTSNLPASIYLLRAIKDGAYFTQKVVK